MEGVEDDLDRSLKHLEEAMSHKSHSLHRKSFRNKALSSDLSVTIRSDELSALGALGALRNNFSDETTMFERSTRHSIAPSAPSIKVTDSLYIEFFEILETHMARDELLNSIAQMSQCCANILKVMKSMEGNQNVEKTNDYIQLQNERNTWRLLYVIFTDRLNRPKSHFEDNESSIYYGLSEKFCMLSLFKRDSLLRESQLVIDWLECNTAESDDEILHFSDSSMGWENTLHQLKSKETIVFESTRNIVSNMDPDAPHYEKLPLHNIDVEDDKRLCHKIFHQIRCGKLIEAQKLCEQSGHFWRAALMEGWKLFHNPNLKDQFSKEYDELEVDEGIYDSQIKKPIEGNINRDLWKRTAWQYCNSDSLNKYEVATIASFCGYLQPLLNVCESWEDYLWAYMRIMVDIRVETELREYVTKTYKPLPDAYWEQRMSINEIFNSLEACKNKKVQGEAMTFQHIVQKHIILDEIPSLLEQVSEWIEDSEINPQFIRFLTHLILFLDLIEQLHNREIVQRVIQEYVKILIRQKQTQLVASYLSHVNEQLHVQIYASYLESITNAEDRKDALKYGTDSGLNVFAVTKQIVENICSRYSKSNVSNMVTEMDKCKISSLDWLYVFNEQLCDAVAHTNSLIFRFLVLNKLDAAQLAFNKVPSDAMQNLRKEAEAQPIPEELKQIIKEHLSYKAYLDAQETFAVWFKHFQSKPIAPILPPENAPLTRKVEYEHRTSQFQSETGRWKLTFGQLTKLAKDNLYNVLLFPDGGWLHGAKDAHYLQKSCIPECTTLLFKVLYDSQQYQECTQLADILANQKYQLFKHFSTQKMADIIRNLADASTALVNQAQHLGYHTHTPKWRLNQLSKKVPFGPDGRQPVPTVPTPHAQAPRPGPRQTEPGPQPQASAALPSVTNGGIFSLRDLLREFVEAHKQNTK